MENIIYKNDRIILSAKYENPQLHKHYSKHILVSNKPFDCFADGKNYNVNSMIIQSQVLHSVIKEKDSLMVVFLIDETSHLSKVIDREYLAKDCKNKLDDEIEKGVIHLIESGSSLDDIDGYVMKQFEYSQLDPSSLDDRILSALKYIQEAETINGEIYDLLSEKICLSKSRFLHLFKEEMGIDLKNYLLLKRMEKAYDLVAKKKMNITEAAIMSGFSSSSHFSRACKLHYGISLTDFLKAQKI